MLLPLAYALLSSYKWRRNTFEVGTIMEESPKREALELAEPREVRAVYVPPAIVYEGKITIRAGSPVGDSPFDGPPSPFGPPGS